MGHFDFFGVFFCFFFKGRQWTEEQTQMKGKKETEEDEGEVTNIAETEEIPTYPLPYMLQVQQALTPTLPL